MRGKLSILRKPTFTTIHYKALAKIIHNLNLNDSERFVVFMNFADALEIDNPMFNFSQFQSYCFTSEVNPKQKGGE
jgi:hypothetical protein